MTELRLPRIDEPQTSEQLRARVLAQTNGAVKNWTLTYDVHDDEARRDDGRDED